MRKGAEATGKTATTEIASIEMCLSLGLGQDHLTEQLLIGWPYPVKQLWPRPQLRNYRARRGRKEERWGNWKNDIWGGEKG